MTQSAPTDAPAIGACIPCRTLFLVLPDARFCPFCANPPSLSLPFFWPYPEPVSVLAEPPSAPTSSPSSGAAEPGVLEPALPDFPAEDISAPPDETLTPVEKASITLAMYLSGETLSLQACEDALSDAGAEPEAAHTALGRLIAIRELLDSLTPSPEAAAPPPGPAGDIPFETAEDVASPAVSSLPDPDEAIRRAMIAESPAPPGEP